MDPPDYIDLKKLKIPNLSQLKILPLVAVFLVAILLFTAWYQVEADSEGVVLRLGKYSRTNGPRAAPENPFWYRKTSTLSRPNASSRKNTASEPIYREQEPSYSALDYPQESLMLTGDLNIADVEWSVQYRISDPFVTISSR